MHPRCEHFFSDIRSPQSVSQFPLPPSPIDLLDSGLCSVLTPHSLLRRLDWSLDIHCSQNVGRSRGMPGDPSKASNQSRRQSGRASRTGKNHSHLKLNRHITLMWCCYRSKTPHLGDTVGEERRPWYRVTLRQVVLGSSQVHYVVRSVTQQPLVIDD